MMLETNSRFRVCCFRRKKAMYKSNRISKPRHTRNAVKEFTCKCQRHEQLNANPFLLLPSWHKKYVFPAERAPLPLPALNVDFCNSTLKNNVHPLILTHYSECGVDLCGLFHTFESTPTIFSEIELQKRSLLTYKTRPYVLIMKGELVKQS